MRKLIYYTTISLDGYFSAADGGLDDFVPTDEEHQYANDLVRGAGALVFGRVMYDLMAYWDTAEPEGPEAPAVAREFAAIYKSKPRHVFSRTLRSLDDPRATVYNSDLAGVVARLKAEDGSYMGLGCGPELLAYFLQEGLVDELRLQIMPMLLGEGISLFKDVKKQHLKLVSTSVFDSGTILATYVPA